MVDVLGMRVKIGEDDIPYPLALLAGRLRLSGLNDAEVSKVITNSITSNVFLKSKTEENLVNAIKNSLDEYEAHIRENFQILTVFEQTRGVSGSTPSFLLVLEGASATGKSMLAMELLRNLAATRFISSDTVRQVIRGIYNKHECPEIHCHTYQAYTFRQSGDPSLDPIVRGYITQSDMIMPHLQDLIIRVLEEGTIAIIEGVHIQPGTFKSIGANVLEILINPSDKTHRAMFLGKFTAGKLRTVAPDSLTRNKEYQATRTIQEYLLFCAMKNGVPVVEMESYENARLEISRLIIERIRHIVGTHA